MLSSEFQSYVHRDANTRSNAHSINRTKSTCVPPIGGLDAPNQHLHLLGCSSGVRNFGDETHITDSQPSNSISNANQPKHPIVYHSSTINRTYSQQVRAHRSIDARLHSGQQRNNFRAVRRKQYRAWKASVQSLTSQPASKHHVTDTDYCTERSPQSKAQQKHRQGGGGIPHAYTFHKS